MKREEETHRPKTILLIFLVPADDFLGLALDLPRIDQHLCLEAHALSHAQHALDWHAAAHGRDDRSSGREEIFGLSDSEPVQGEKVVVGYVRNLLLASGNVGGRRLSGVEGTE